MNHSLPCFFKYFFLSYSLCSLSTLMLGLILSHRSQTLLYFFHYFCLSFDTFYWHFFPHFKQEVYLNNKMLGNFLVVQWLGVLALTAKGPGSIPGQGKQDAWCEGKTMIHFFQDNLFLFKGRLLYMQKRYNIVLGFTMINEKN